MNPCTASQDAYGGAQRALMECLPNTGLDIWPVAAAGGFFLCLGLAIGIYLSRSAT